MERSELELALPEELQLLLQAVRDFARAEISPRHERIDHDAKHPTEVVDQIRDLGLFGALAPVESGGSGLSFLAQTVAVEALAEGAGVIGAILAAHGIVVDALGLAKRQDAVMAALAGGTSLGAPALMEHDAGVVACAAKEQGGAWRLTGVKCLVPFPGRAGAFLVLAKEPAGKALFLVEAGASGVEHDAREETLGLLGMETATLRLTNAPASRLGGAELVAIVIGGARISVAALLCGVGRGAINHALRYAGERKQFEQPLLSFVAIKERLARSDWRVEAARAATYSAARLHDRHEPFGLAAARARAAAGEAAILAADDALQIYGGYGYSREYPAERFYRDARFPGFGEAHPTTLAADVVAALAE